LRDEKAKGGENLNLKIVLMVFLVLFASTIAVTIAFSVPKFDIFSKTQNAILDVASGIQPLGDPVDNPNLPN
jgi:flagellar basal body-associated protein FliL